MKSPQERKDIFDSQYLTPGFLKISKIQPFSKNEIEFANLEIR